MAESGLPNDGAENLRLAQYVNMRRTVLRARFAVDAARDSRNAHAIALAEAELRAAVLDAIDGGCSRQTIGEVLLLRRGAAYQRFRKRPPASDDRGHDQPPP